MTVARSLHELDAAWVAAIEPATMLERALSQDNPARTTRPGRHGTVAAGDGDAVPRPVTALAEPAEDVTALLGAGPERLDAVLAELDGDDEDAGGALGAVVFMQDRRLEIASAVGRLSGLRTLLDLRALAQRRDRADGGCAWIEWWSVVVGWVDDVLAAMRPIDEALAGCWRELSERPHVHLATASVGRLRVHEPAPPPPEDVTARRLRPSLRPVSAPRTGDL